MIRVFFRMRSAAKTPNPCTGDRRRTIAGSVAARVILEKHMLRHRGKWRYAADSMTFDSRLVDALRRAQRILIFSGAGVSTASGIPDFRGPDGGWTRRRPRVYDEVLASGSARPADLG